MQTILALNAFDHDTASRLTGGLAQRVQRRREVFGAASMLFYDEPLEFVRGAGCWLYDAHGTPYLDAYNNVPSVGHSHPTVVEALTRQLARLNVHGRYVDDGVTEYAQRLLATFPAALSNITFTCTGSEANDLALRAAAAFTGGQGVIVTDCAYHGNTALVTQASPSSFKKGGVPAHVRSVAPAADTFTAAVSGAIADLQAHGIGLSALIVDSIFSSDGVYADPAGFLQPAIAAVHRAGGLFIADEVQPGFGRTGTHLWGFDRHGVQPDLVTLGKPMGNGYPVAAMIARPEILNAFCSQVGYFNTFGGTAAAAAAGMAVLDVLEQERLMHNAAAVGAYLKQRLQTLASRHPQIREVRGAGLYLGVEVEEGCASVIINGLRQRRVLIGAAGRLGGTLKIRPPLCLSCADVDLLVGALADVLSA